MLKKITYFLPAALIAFVVVSCQVQEVPLQGEISEEVIAKISNMGFNPDGIEAVEEGYRIERDIIITHELLASTPTSAVVPNYEQYRTTNLVTAGVPGRVITMYAQQGGSTGYSAGMIAGLDMAIARYNAMNLGISFQRVTSSSGADIQMTRLKKGEERQGILGSAGFPTASGNPYNQIKMSGILESSYGLSTAGIATIIAHEMGHCIGLRHTDYFDRSISCGGAATNEGASSVGAIHIPGTPTGATLSAQSYMLSCTDGSDRPFNADDQTALNYLY